MLRNNPKQVPSLNPPEHGTAIPVTSPARRPPPTCPFILTNKEKEPKRGLSYPSNAPEQPESSSFSEPRRTRKFDPPRRERGLYAPPPMRSTGILHFSFNRHQSRKFGRLPSLIARSDADR